MSSENYQYNETFTFIPLRTSSNGLLEVFIENIKKKGDEIPSFITPELVPLDENVKSSAENYATKINLSLQEQEIKFLRKEFYYQKQYKDTSRANISADIYGNNTCITCYFIDASDWDSNNINNIEKYRKRQFVWVELITLFSPYSLITYGKNENFNEQIVEHLKVYVEEGFNVRSESFEEKTNSNEPKKYKRSKTRKYKKKPIRKSPRKLKKPRSRKLRY